MVFRFSISRTSSWVRYWLGTRACDILHSLLTASTLLTLAEILESQKGNWVNCVCVCACVLSLTHMMWVSVEAGWGHWGVLLYHSLPYLFEMESY